MRTLVWHVPPEYGHFAPTLVLARQLAAQGCRSVYLSEPDMQDHIEREGFAYVPYLPGRYPRGALHARDQLTGDGTWEWWLGRDLAMWQEAVSGRLEAVLAALAPDVILASQLNPDTSLVAHKMGIPFIRVSCSLPLYYEPDIPPMWSDALPGELSRRELEIEWMCHEAMLWRAPWIHRDNPIKRSEFYQFVEACGLDLAQINYRSAFNWHVESDAEIITCSKAFDFPRPELPERAYIGPCLTEMTGARWSYPARRPDAPLVYCAFGSKGGSYAAARRFLDPLLAAARARPDLDVVVASLPDEVFAGRDLPPTVHRLLWAPQREVLREASLFITHAGLGSCREAIWDGVPMLAVPQAHDQHGVAARIVYHGLGERILGELSPRQLIDTIDRLITDPRYRRAATQMRDRFRADDNGGIGPRFVTDLIEGRIPSLTAHHYRTVTKRLFRAIMGDD